MSLSVKTAISIEKSLLNKANELAESMHTSRSKIFTFALLDFIKKNENKEMFKQINNAYTPDMEEDDKVLAKNMKFMLKNKNSDLW